MIASLEKAASIIGLMGGPQRDWSVQELARALGMPQPTVHHFLASLRELGWVAQEAKTRRYRLGIRLWEIGCASINFREIAESARPALNVLVDTCAETAHLGMISAEDPTQVTYIDRVDSNKPVRIVTMIGTRVPSHSSTMGKAILAHNPDFLARVLQGPLEKVTPHTLNDPTTLEADLRLTRERGYAIGRGEFSGEMIGIAAPVHDHLGVVTTGIGLWAPVAQVPEDFIERCAPHVMHAARQISRARGWMGA